jgi:hypothetical protein
MSESCPNPELEVFKPGINIYQKTLSEQFNFGESAA